ncbi:MAG: glycosyltransferase family 2 protein [Anaerolineae bacterium]
MTSLTLIIPAFNESEGVDLTAGKLRPVMDTLRQSYTLETIFVNDGSRDATEELLKKAFSDDPTVKVLSHERNMGLGAAIRTGFQHATGDFLVTTDFDGTYDFAGITRLLDALISENADIATASPYHPQGKVEGVPESRLIFSKGASLLYRMVVTWHIYTWTALFRAYRRDVIEHVGFRSDDFLAGTELLVNALRAGFKVVEVPMVLRRRTFGQSSIRIARVTSAHLRFQLGILFRTYRAPGPVRSPASD